jgi:hypothetical protein
MQDDIRYEPFPRAVVQAVDRIVEKTNVLNFPEAVDTEAAWRIVDDVFKLWKRFYPHEYSAFVKSQKDFRRSQANKHGSAREKGGAEMQHLIEVHPRLHHILKNFFPRQQWDKKFIMKLVKRIPELQVPDKL